MKSNTLLLIIIAAILIVGGVSYAAYSLAKKVTQMGEAFGRLGQDFKESMEESKKNNDSLRQSVASENFDKANKVAALSTSFCLYMDEMKARSLKKDEVFNELNDSILTTRVNMLALVDDETEREEMLIRTRFRELDEDIREQLKKISNGGRAALMTKIQNDCRSLESEILVYLSEKKNKEYTFDDIN
ncbi:MAG: hypothetical protein V4613_12360 [Bacteroidota bacterium]